MTQEGAYLLLVECESRFRVPMYTTWLGTFVVSLLGEYLRGGGADGKKNIIYSLVKCC
jgi:hypothetical protein